MEDRGLLSHQVDIIQELGRGPGHNQGRFLLR